MIRLIKRYESRKLYDTEESRYVSLDEISTWIRSGQEVRVVDNATNNDVTSGNRYLGHESVTVPAFPSGVMAAKVESVITQAGAMNFRTSMVSTALFGKSLPVIQWIGASKCVPVCSPRLMLFQYHAGPRSS